MAFTEEAQKGLQAAAGEQAGWPGRAPWMADGSYVLAPQRITDEDQRLRIEACLVRPRQGQLDAMARTRVVHHLKRAIGSNSSSSEAATWQLDTIEVSCATPSRPWTQCRVS